MSRKIVWMGALSLLGAVLLLATPSQAHAQRGGRGGMGMGMGTGMGMGMPMGMGTGMRPGMGTGMGMPMGMGTGMRPAINTGGMTTGAVGVPSTGTVQVPGSNGGMRPNHWPNNWWWWWNRYGMWYPSYGGYGLMYPSYGGYGGYVDPAYSSAARSYGSYASSAVPTDSYYPRLNGPAIPEDEDRAHLRIQLPPDAEVTIQGTTLNATGPIRQFDSPPLKPGKRYTYEVEVKWKDGDKEVTQSQEIDLSAGTRAQVIFRPGAKPLVRGAPGVPTASTR